MNLAFAPFSLKFYSRIVLIGAMAMALSSTRARAAELVMFEQAGCVWCEAFNRDIGTVYAKTDEGARAPLRRIDISQATPPDLAFIEVERVTPVFVLVDKGQEIGRIRGYPSEDHFWGLLDVLIGKLDQPDTGNKMRTQLMENALRAVD
jgi:thioredoxin-related protein